MVLGPIETAYLIAFALIIVTILCRLAKRYPNLVSRRDEFLVILFLSLELALVVYGIADTKLNLFGRVTIPAIGAIFLVNIFEAFGLTIASLFIAKKGVVWTALYLLPVWIFFHDGIYFFITDLLHGDAPFVYSQMIYTTYPISYYGQFLVDIFQALVFIFILKRLFRSRLSFSSKYGATALIMFLSIVILNIAANVFTHQLSPPNIYPYFNVFYDLFYTAFVYLLLVVKIPVRSESTTEDATELYTSM